MPMINSSSLASLLILLIACATHAAQSISPQRTHAAMKAATTNKTNLDARAIQRQRKRSRPSDEPPLKLTPHKISLANGRTFMLDLPENFEIKVAAEGLKRVRFMAQSPDGRIFVTDMFNLTDNRRGVVYILDDFDAASGKFGTITPYLTGLRNPNSIAFYTDARSQSWLYLALTDRLVRYRYAAGDVAPTSAPETLATFPDYGLSYKYGGWHLTRTVAFGPNGKIYIAAGSSCNACEEKEEVRASVTEMDADGRHRRIFARGLRNAVGVRFIEGQLFVTNMGADHLGDDKPEDTMYAVEDGANYGWPYCYQYRGRVAADAQFSKSAKKTDCRKVPLSLVSFLAHSSPLGFDYFDSTTSDAVLRDSFLVALHGSTKEKLGHGYRLARVRRGAGGTPASTQNFMLGFLRDGKIYGRPADVMRLSADSFLFTDDHAGVVYYVFRKI